MLPKETITVTSSKVFCDGGSVSGHPRVFLTIADKGSVDCPYCCRHYVLSANAQAHMDH